MGCERDPMAWSGAHENRRRSNDALDLLKHIPEGAGEGQQLGILGKEQVLVKMKRLAACRDASEIAGLLLQGLRCGAYRSCGGHPQPPLRYDPDGNTAMIILHTSSLFGVYGRGDWH